MPSCLFDRHHEKKAAQNEDLRSMAVQADSLKYAWVLPLQREEKVVSQRP